MWEALLPSLVSAGANIFGGMTSAAGQASANSANIQMQQATNAQNLMIYRDNQAWQERMANTAYQRQMQDMEQAGLNPILAYQKGGGAATPNVGTPTMNAPQVQNASGDLGRAIGAAGSSAVTSYKDMQAAKQLEEQQDLTKQMRHLTREKVDVENANIFKTKQETERLKHETSAAEAAAKIKWLEHEQYKNYGPQGNNPSAYGGNIEALTRRVIETMNNGY